MPRRDLLRLGVGAALAALVSPGSRAAAGSRPQFSPVAVSTADDVTVPPGYRVQVLYAWGDATGVTAAAPAFSASAGAEEQAAQAGMHHDGMHFFPIGGGRRGLLAINHEYTDDGLLHPDGMKTWTAAKVRKAQAAHGVSVIEVEDSAGGWRVVRPSRYARRITAYTPVRIAGPAAGHAMMRTERDPGGMLAQGTLNNCAAGATPWGTYLTCEENWNGYFNGRAVPTAAEARYGVRPGGAGYRWHEHDACFDVASNPNEPHRFGWVVEIDPFDPEAAPVKRTALGRFKHEGATVTRSRDGRAVVYMGDDERFEYIYKFVSRDRIRPGGAAANADLLDHGTLHVARFEADGSGRWIALAHGREGLTAADGFASQAEVLIRCREAADRAGATRMDRPEWVAVHPGTGEVFVTLTNNADRGQPGRAPVDAANPRAANVYGHVIRWRERGDAASDAFAWQIFALAGDPESADPASRGTLAPGAGFGSPDGLWVDPGGMLWIQTDVSTSALGKGPYARLGNNQMLAADPASGEIRRFLVGPRGCEITGITMAPDMRSLFVNIQHPGETASERSDPDRPTAVSSWPRHAQSDRPRSATIVITREDGGVIGR